MADGTLLLWSALWLAIAAIVWVRHWRSGRGVGLVFSYILAFGASYWLAPAIYLLPWYHATWYDVSTVGLRYSTIAFAAFAAGGEIGVALVPASAQVGAPRSMTAPATACVLIGALLYAVVAPFTRGIASVSAVVSIGSSLVVGGFVMRCWDAWHAGQRATLWKWLALTAVLPAFTVIGQGFLGYGFAAVVTIFAFVATVYQPRWKVVVIGVAATYVGLSIFVTYMRDRSEIRAAVWGGAPMSDRLAQLEDTATNFEWFDLQNASHLSIIDSRMNQDRLMGTSVEYLADGSVPFAHGSTLLGAVLAEIPRAFWPDKTEVAGSGDLVSTYTGLKFAADTSVGIGPVMECYVNFGLPGVIVGFLIIGALLVVVDRVSGDALRGGDVERFLYWYLPGLSLLMVGFAFVEVTSSAGAAWVLAYLVSRFALPRQPPRIVIVGAPPPRRAGGLDRHPTS